MIFSPASNLYHSIVIFSCHEKWTVVILPVSVLAKYLMHHKVIIQERPGTPWTDPSQELRQTVDFSNHKNGNNPVSFTDIVLTFGVVVPESHFKYILRVQTDCFGFLCNTSKCKVARDAQCFKKTCFIQN